MANFHVKWWFSAGDYGFTEDLWWSAAGQGIQVCIKDTIALTEKRMKMLAYNWSLDGVSIDEYPTQRGTTMLYSEVGAGPGNYNLANNCPDLRVMCRLAEVTFTWKRSYWLGGIPKDVADWSPDLVAGNPVLVPAWRDLLFAWIAEAGFVQIGGVEPPARRWAIRHRGEDASTKVIRHKILAVSAPAPSRHWIITVPTDETTFLGDTIHVHGVTGCTAKGLNGDHKVMAVGATIGPPIGDTMTLTGRQCCVGPIGARDVAKGTWYLKQLFFSALTQAAIARITLRKTGVPGFKKPGKARPNVCCN